VANFKIGDRVVFKGNLTFIVKGYSTFPIKAGDRGTVVSISTADSSRVFVRTDDARLCWVNADDLELDATPESPQE